MQHYLHAMRQYAVFRGRASRAEFWQFLLVYVAIGFALALVSQALFGVDGDGSQVLPGLWTVVHFLPALAVTVRRLHDIDRTGWWVLINVTGIGSIIGFVFALMPGTEGPNRFDEALVDGRQRSPVEPGALVPPRWDVEPTIGRTDEPSFGTFAHGPGSTPASAVGPHAAPPSVMHPAPTAASRPIDVIGDLERLSQLRAAGGLSDAEFETLKARTLAGVA